MRKGGVIGSVFRAWPLTDGAACFILPCLIIMSGEATQTFAPTSFEVFPKLLVKPLQDGEVEDSLPSFVPYEGDGVELDNVANSWALRDAGDAGLQGGGWGVGRGARECSRFPIIPRPFLDLESPTTAQV